MAAQRRSRDRRGHRQVEHQAHHALSARVCGRSDVGHQVPPDRHAQAGQAGRAVRWHRAGHRRTHCLRRLRHDLGRRRPRQDDPALPESAHRRSDVGPAHQQPRHRRQRALRHAAVEPLQGGSPVPPRHGARVQHAFRPHRLLPSRSAARPEHRQHARPAARVLLRRPRDLGRRQAPVPPGDPPGLGDRVCPWSGRLHARPRLDEGLLQAAAAVDPQLVASRPPGGGPRLGLGASRRSPCS